MFNDFENRSSSFNSSSFEGDYFFLKDSTLSKLDRFHNLGFSDNINYHDDDWRFFSNRRRNCFSFNVFGFVVVYDLENKVWSLHFSVIGFIINIIALIFILLSIFKF